MGDDQEARNRRADELRRAIQEAAGRPPATPREFTDQEAKGAASQRQRERPGEED